MAKISFKQFLFEREIHAKKIVDAPIWSPAHAESHYKIGQITFSASDGLGSVPNNQSVWYMGFVGMMKPSTFMSLALDDEGHQEPTSRDLEELSNQGYAIGIPFLEIEIDEDGKEFPRIKGHEGRGRMRMVRRLLGDEPVPIHFFLRGGMRSRHLTKEMIDEIKQGIYAEKSDRLVKNPVSKVWVDGTEM
jgi:hypothetical protein